MSPTQAITSVLHKYADFSGRAGRPEFWWWWGAMLVVLVVMGVLAGLIGTVGAVVAVVISLAIILPSLAVGVRRLHDTGRSGWWLLISFIPLVGNLILLVLFALESEHEPNAWGAPPS